MRIIRKAFRSTSYEVHRGHETQFSLAGQTPARFNLKLGAGVNQGPSQQPFCAPSECSAMKLRYRSSCLLTRPATSDALGEVAPFVESPGRLPIGPTVGASSAFLGGFTAMLPLNLDMAGGLIGAFEGWCKRLPLVTNSQCQTIADWLMNVVQLDWAVWTLFEDADGPVPPEDIFIKGAALRQQLLDKRGAMKQPVLDAMAAGQFMAIYDGGYTDNTAIASAVAAGATEIVAWLDAGGLWALFHGAQKTISLLPNMDSCPLCFVNFPVFGEDWEATKEAFDKSAYHLEPPTDAQKLKGLVVGTVTGTTVDSPYFSISEGRPVTIHVILIDTSISIGGYDYHDYAVLISEIMHTIETHPEAAKAILAWFGQ